MNQDCTPHLFRLREALWCNREVGHASVLVGAGFSRNARPRLPTSAVFPLWNDVAKAMAADLKIGHQAASPLRLASQYEAAFGRPALDALLLRLIPDNQYEPGEAHHLLLSLPWADVFTTNYDTLLEQARSIVPTRRYDVIRTTEDIPQCARPRIVKLHGSMPSHRPFVATEEDYRRYPHDSAPFVNTVQQDAMETLLCLLGFGGDDPNFLQWTGWVRDNLGKHAPTIMLIGILDLPESERAILASRHVTLVDLGPLFPATEFNDPQTRQQKAAIWLLRSLHNGRPQDIRNWPSITRQHTYPNEPGLPDLLPPPSRADIPEKPAPARVGHRLTAKEALELAAFWKAQRLAYPGWLVCPEDNRRILVQRSWWSTQEIISAITELPLHERLWVLFELTWRLRRSLLPVFDDCVKAVGELLEQINPWPSRLADIVGTRLLTPLSKIDQTIDWSFVEEEWVFLCFVLLRDARLCFDDARFDKWYDRLSKVADIKLEWQHWHQYEYCLRLLLQLKFIPLRKALKKWGELPSATSPVWLGRQAAMLGEIGELDAARLDTQKALDRARSLGTEVSEFSISSLEGWLIGLQNILGSASWPGKKYAEDPIYDSRSRLTVLGGLYRCDPLLDLDERRAALRKPVSPAHESKSGFDPGVVYSTHHIETGLDDAPWALPLMVEEGCWPLRAGHYCVAGKEISISAFRLAEHLPEYALSILIRCQSDGLEQWLSRAEIAVLKDEVVASLYSLLDCGIRDALEARDFSGRLDQCLEALSRLCFRLTSPQLQQALALATRIYVSPEASSHWGTVRRLDVLFKRLLFTMSPPDLDQGISVMLDLPTRGSQERPGFDVPDPFQHFDRENLKLCEVKRREEWKELIADLLRKSKVGDGATRSHALSRLAVLFGVGVLSSDETVEMGEALWKRADGNNLPADAPFSTPFLLHLPEPISGVARERVRARFLEQPFPSLRRAEPEISSLDLLEATRFFADLFGCTRRPWYSSEIGNIRIEWSSEEIRKLLTEGKSWWTETKASLERLLMRGPNDDFARFARRIICGYVRLVGDIIAMRLSDGSAEEVKVASELVKDAQSLDARSVLVAPHGLLRLGAPLDEVKKAIGLALFAFEYDDATEVVSGVVGWKLWSKTQNVVPPPSELIDRFISYSVMHRDSSLALWLQAVTDLIHFAPEAITDSHFEVLTLGLERLLEDTRLIPRSGVSSDALHDRADARRRAANLASALDRWCTSHRKITAPAALNAWRDACSADPLPEVRHAWTP